MPLAMTAEAALITNAPVSNENERIRFSIDQRRRSPAGPLAAPPECIGWLARTVLFTSPHLIRHLFASGQLLLARLGTRERTGLDIAA